MRTPAANAELALHLEATAAPTPGNVDRARDHPELTLEHFLAGAVGARSGLEAAASGAPIGDAFERAVEGMSQQTGTNTQFGALLLLVPLVRAAADGSLDPAGVDGVVRSTTVEDACGFYRAFEHVDVHVGDPPPDLEPLDVRRGVDAIPAVRERKLSFRDVLAAGADDDDLAREWTTGFERTFETAARLSGAAGETSIERDDDAVPVGDWIGDAERLVDRVARTHLALLAERPDTLVATVHGDGVARSVRDRAAELLATLPEEQPDIDAIDAFADDLVAQGINPGTTADHLAAGLFVALEREEIEV